MKNKKIFWIVWAVMICAMILLRVVPSGTSEEPSDNREKNMEYIEYSPDRVLSSMDVNDVLGSRDPSSEWSEDKCNEWERFAFFADKAYSSGDYTLLGLNGDMTYYFDSEDKLVFSCFTVYTENAEDTANMIINELNDMYTEPIYSRSMGLSSGDDEHYEKEWFYVITPNGNDYNYYREWEYISVFMDADCNSLYIYQFGWGLDPMPYGSGLCTATTLHDFYISKFQCSE